MDDLVLVIYRYFTRTWSGTFCIDVLQLIQKSKIVHNPQFEKWRDVDVRGTGLEIYINKNLKDELEANYESIKINARTWKLFGKYRGSFTLEIIN